MQISRPNIATAEKTVFYCKQRFFILLQHVNATFCLKVCYMDCVAAWRWRHM